MAFGLRHILDAFVFYTGQGGPAEELDDISYWINVMKAADYVAQTAIGDAILVRRLSIWLICLYRFLTTGRYRSIAYI